MYFKIYQSDILYHSETKTINPLETMFIIINGKFTNHKQTVYIPHHQHDHHDDDDYVWVSTSSVTVQQCHVSTHPVHYNERKYNPLIKNFTLFYKCAWSFP